MTDDNFTKIYNLFVARIRNICVVLLVTCLRNPKNTHLKTHGLNISWLLQLVTPVFLFCVTKKSKCD